MSTRAWVLFGVVSIVWGMPYFFIKIAVRELDPTVIVFVRTLLAAAVMLPLALYRRELGRALRHWKAVLLLTFAEIVIPFLLITYGERRVSSSLAGLLIAALPLVVALLAVRLDVTERVAGPRLFGMLVGLSGVALVLGFNLGGGWSQVIGAAMILGATLCYAGGTFILKLGLSSAPTFGVVAATTSLATVLLAPFALVQLPATVPSASVWVSMAGLGVICTAVAFVAYFGLVTEAGPARATVITYINPAVAVVLGVWLLGEPLTATVAAGFLLIIAGSWLSTGGTLPPRLLATGRRLLPARRGRRRAPQPQAELAT